MKKLLDYLKENKKTAFLKMVLVILFTPVAFISCIAAPQLIIESVINPEIQFWYVMPFSVCMFLVLFPVAYAIVQTWKLYIYIENNTFFSDKTCDNLQRIVISAIVASVLFVGMIPSVFHFVEMDDSPGLALINLMFVGVSISISVFASLLKDVINEKIRPQSVL